MVRPTKEIKDVENSGSNHRLCSCLERLSRECVPGRYATQLNPHSRLGIDTPGEYPTDSSINEEAVLQPDLIHN